MRKECPELGWGRYRVLKAPAGVLAVCCEWRGSRIITLHNFSAKPAVVELRQRDAGRRLVDVIDEEHSTAAGRAPHRIRLPAHGYRWYRVGSVEGPRDG
jgi:maltose alpha-D-glucosyltransferase/alpha-amylase